MDPVSQNIGFNTALVNYLFLFLSFLENFPTLHYGQLNHEKVHGICFSQQRKLK